jgi:hypothetical protein
VSLSTTAIIEKRAIIFTSFPKTDGSQTPKQKNGYYYIPKQKNGYYYFYFISKNEWLTDPETEKRTEKRTKISRFYNHKKHGRTVLRLLATLLGIILLLLISFVSNERASILFWVVLSGVLMLPE